MKRHPMRLIGTILGFSFTLSIAGCDYWPPALQAEIEQLRSETQTLTIEKTELQAQVTDLYKTKQELQGQLGDLSRLNREKTGMITSLQTQLDAAHARALKAMTPKSALHRTPTKPAMKVRPAPKSLPKAPANKNRTPKAMSVR